MTRSMTARDLFTATFPWRAFRTLALIGCFAATTSCGGGGGPRPIDALAEHVGAPDGRATTAILALASAAETLNIVTVAGEDAEIGDGGPATSALLNSPGVVASDAAGNRYISEGGGHRVRKVTPSGIITTFAGTGGSGFNCDGIPATTAQLNTPRGLVFDASGNLYVVENGGHRVRKINLATGIITTVAGTGVAGSSGDGLLATEAQLNGPGFAVFDALGNLYISEVNGNRIRKIDTAGIITTFAGTGVAGFAGDENPATTAQFRNPNALAIDSAGNFYIADVNNNRVRKVSLATGIITTVAGTGVVGFNGDSILATTAQLNGPRTVTVDSAGNLYIGDFNNHRVRRVDASGIITTFAGTGVRGVVGGEGDDDLATAARLNGPNGVAFDSGVLYICETLGQRVRLVSLATGIISTFAGGGVPILGDGGSATAAQISPSGSVAFDASANLYLADLGNNRIRKVDRATGIITTIAGTGVAGSLGDGEPAIAAQLNGPFAVAADASGNLYVADSTGRRVRRIDLVAGIITTVAGTGVSGSAGDGLPATSAQVNNPQGVAVDGSGNLYISELAGFRVRRVDVGTGIITTVAGNGLTGSSGDDGLAVAARLNAPMGIFVDAAAQLYIADTGNNRVRKVDLVTGIITTVAGTGIGGFSGDDGPATAAKLSTPQAVATDAAGNLYIADVGNNRIRKVDASGVITTFAGTGVAGFAGDGGPATAARFSGPRGVTFDSSGNLYINDSANTRIRRLNVAAQISVSPSTLALSSNGKWLTVYVQLPAGRDASTVAIGSVRLQAIDPMNGSLRHAASGPVLELPVASNSPTQLIDTNGDSVPDKLALKFDRASVASWAAEVSSLVLRVEGQFEAPAGSPVGTCFSGDVVLPTRRVNRGD
jgi:trimeric autotransporter adhesin